MVLGIRSCINKDFILENLSRTVSHSYQSPSPFEAPSLRRPRSYSGADPSRECLFSLKTGENLGPPGADGVPRHSVRVEDDDFSWDPSESTPLGNDGLPL